jgi:hypothetical protein
MMLSHFNVNTLYQSKSALTYDFFDDCRFCLHINHLPLNLNILVPHQGPITPMMKT